MATFILVHGRSQQFQNRIQLEQRWEQSLAAGMLAGGASTGPRPEEVLFPFYGSLFESFSLAAQPTSVEEKRELLEFERQFAQQVEQKMRRRGHTLLQPTADEAVAAGFFDPLISILDRVPGLGNGVLRFFLQDIHAYFRNKDGLRDKTMDLVRAPIENSQADTLIVIAHSLGSIVTYDILNTHPNLKVDLYITIGSPLGVAGTVTGKLLADASGRRDAPAGVKNWVNFADSEDVVALDEKLADDFRRGGQRIVRDVNVKNSPNNPHSSDDYLRQPALGKAILDFLGGAGLGGVGLGGAALTGVSPPLTSVLGNSPAESGIERLSLAGSPSGRTTASDSAAETLRIASEVARSGLTPGIAAAGGGFSLALAAGTRKVRSSKIADDLKASGTARVIVVMDGQGPGSQSGLALGGGPFGAASLGVSVPAAGRSLPAASFALASDLARYFVPSQQDMALAAAASRSETLSLASLASAGPPKTPPAARFYPNLGVMLGTVTPQALAGLEAHPGVGEVVGTPEISLIRPKDLKEFKSIRDANAALSAAAAGGGTEGGPGQTWGIARLGIPKLWKQFNLRGRGVLVGHLDTGVALHPALPREAIAHFARFDQMGELDPNSVDPFDSAWHGTHTAATIVGRAMDGFAIGVAPEATLASACVIEGGDVIARILGGLDWVIDQGVRIVSLSLGLRGYTEDFLTIVQLLRQKGILPVIAVGNEGPGTSRSPGNYSEALSVGAIAEGDSMWSSSSSFEFQRVLDSVVPDVVGPGADVVSAMPDGRVAASSGTSMATPHIAGLAALLLEAKPDATVEQLESAIFQSCRLPEGMVRSRAGRGIPDAVAALKALVPEADESGAGVSAEPIDAPVPRAAARRPKRARRKKSS